MVAYVFSRLITRGRDAGYVPAQTSEARTWFREQAEATNVTPSRVINQSSESSTSSISIPGNMVLFNYDPKTKANLPYYDRFPLIFVVERYSKGFLGINLHYLPLNYRAILMDNLYELLNNKNYNESTRLRLSYEVLKSASRFRYAKPCFKQYLNERVRSRFINIDVNQWDVALFLPLQRFEKANKTRIYRDSVRKFQ